MAKIEDILFWLLMIVVIVITLWLLFGKSPTLESSLIQISLFIVASEILLWKTIFRIDKRTTVGFTKIKNNLNAIKQDISIIKKNIENIKYKKR